MAGIAVPSLLSLCVVCAACAEPQPRVAVAPAAPSVPAPAPAPAPTTSSSAAAATATATATASPAATATATATATASAPAPVPPTPSLTPATAIINDPSFDKNGDVPDAKSSVDKLKRRIEKCVNVEGGVPSDGASIKLQFLVRAQGIAEGVEVLDAKNIGEKAGRCIRDAFKKKKIGPPSADPVGVTVTIDFSAKEPS